jgi:hypothetical protein
MIVVRSPLMNRPIWVAEESRVTQLFIQRSLLDNLCRDRCIVSTDANSNNIFGAVEPKSSASLLRHLGIGRLKVERTGALPNTPVLLLSLPDVSYPTL